MNPDRYDQLMSELEQAKPSPETQQRLAQLQQEAEAARTSVEVRNIRGQVCLVFGTEVSSIGMTPELARQIADGLRRGADQLDPPKPGRHRHKPRRG